MTWDVSWIRAARKDFGKFPEVAQERFLDALVVVSQGQMPGSAKPLANLGAGVFEITVPYRTDTYRTVYALKIDDDIWIVHAFKKKSHKGIKTPKPDIDLVKERIKRLKESLK